MKVYNRIHILLGFPNSNFDLKGVKFPLNVAKDTNYFVAIEVVK
jgi:hypothetical protein